MRFLAKEETIVRIFFFIVLSIEFSINNKPSSTTKYNICTQQCRWNNSSSMVIVNNLAQTYKTIFL